MDNFAWTCPHCMHPQTGGSANHRGQFWEPKVTDPDIGKISVHSEVKVCLNANCKKLSLATTLWTAALGKEGKLNWSRVKTWCLLPESTARPQPDYIPKAIRSDYQEACLIRDLSPKASATLARKCLQGIIEDFCGIAKDSLRDATAELQKLVAEEKGPRGVTSESAEAIGNVCSIGNIGTHMGAQTNLITDIDANEAQILIELIETLFEEWYVARDAREKRFASIKALGEENRTTGTREV